MKKNLRRLTFTAFSISMIVMCLSFYACNDNVITAPEDIVFPDSNVSYVNHVAPLLKYTCARSGCHSTFDRAGGFALDTYYDLTTSFAGAMCRPGNADGSILIQVIEGKLPHSYITEFRISDNQLLGLKTWINEGISVN